jgi:hypothetical protein
MVDKPETGEKGDEAKIKESSTSPIAGTPKGDTPETRSPSQTENTGKTRKYAMYVLWPVAALWRLFRWLFLWANEHGPGITALATIAIMVLTFFYVRYSKRQWKVMSGQLEEMKKSTDLAKAVAKIANGQPTMWVSDIEVFHEEENRKVWATVGVSNKGKNYADHISVATLVDILPMEPPKPRKFITGDTGDFHDISVSCSTPDRKWTSTFIGSDSIAFPYRLHPFQRFFASYQTENHRVLCKHSRDTSAAYEL